MAKNPREEVDHNHQVEQHLVLFDSSHPGRIDLNHRLMRVSTWDEFRELLTRLSPMEVFYAQGHAPLSTPPVELRLLFNTKDAQYLFIDTGKGSSLRRTKIPVKIDKYRNFVLEEEDIKKFIRTQLGRDDIKIRSFELMGGY